MALPSACRAAEGATTPPGPVVLTGLAGLARGGAANSNAFRALQAALAEGEDDRARAIIATLRSRALDPREREIVDSAERVLDGRALVRCLRLELVSEPVPGAEGRFRLVLVARSEATQAVCLRLPPSDLKRSRASIDPRGLEGLEFDSRASKALRELVLVPTVEQRCELLAYELPLGSALGVRERWRLEPRSGEIEFGGVHYPAANLKVKGCERERLSPLLESGSAAATALAGALEAEPAPGSVALLALALRTPASERRAALQALAPVVARLARAAPERVVRAEPALRWLTQNRTLGPDAEAWARYLAARCAAAEAAESAPNDGLDLPRRNHAGAGGRS